MSQALKKLYNDSDLPARPHLHLVPAGAGGGGKGGGGGGRTPVEDPDTLQSSAFASIIDAIGNGEIKGLVHGMESIYLDNIPLVLNGVTNFSGVEVEWRNGTQSQTHIAGFPSSTNTTQLGVEIRASQPALAQVTNVEADAFAVTVAVGGLSEQSTKTGDVKGSSVQLRVEYQAQNTGWIPAGEITITGKTRSRYQETHRFPLTGTGPWTVRVTRLTPDSTSQALINSTFLDYMSSLVDLKLSYPNTALVGIKIDARQFGSIPTRSYDVEGMIIRVPNNYDPELRTYSGVWNGGFKLAYSNNPAWCLYEMLTNPIFGLGEYMDASQIPKDVLYTIGQYCDELVPDGYGGMEPRFTLNCVIQSEGQAYKVMQDLCSVFRGMTYWGGGMLVPVIDMPKTPGRKFTPANVVDGEFVRQGSDRMARHSVALITWNNPEDSYRQNTEYVEDRDALATYGYRPTDAVAFGCTSRGQANRLGRWILASERLETDQWSWKTGQEAATLEPGEIVQCTDPVYAGSDANNPNGRRMGGRVLAATRDEITLDGPVEFEAGVSYTLFYVDPTGADRSVGVINPGVGKFSHLDFVSTVLPGQEPQVGDVWMISALNRLEPALVRILQVKEDGDGVYSVTGTTHAAQKFAEVDFNTRLEPPPTGLGNGLIPLTPSNFFAMDTTFLSAPGTLGLKLFASWTGNTTSYQVRWRVNGGAWNEDVRNSPSIDLLNVAEEDVYDFMIWGVGADNARSPQPLEATYTILGKSAPPGPCTNLAAVGQYKTILLTWVPPDDLDLAYVEVFESTQNDFLTAVKVGQASTTITLSVVGLEARQGRYYWVRAVDTSGNVGPINSNLGTYGETIPLYTSDFEGEINADQLANDVVEQITNEVITQVGPGIVQDAVDRVRGITADSTAVTADSTTVFAGTRSVYSDTIENDRAQAKAIQVTIARLNDEISATIARETIARVAADEAMVSDYTGMVATLGDNLTAVIEQERIARVTADEAMVSDYTSMVAQLDTNLSAAITTERNARVTADEAMASDLTRLEAQITDDIVAAIEEERIARTTADSALAQVQTTLGVRVGDVEVLAQDTTTVVANMQGQAEATRVIKLQQFVDGKYYAASMGLGVYDTGAGVQTSIYFQADRFALLNVANGWTTTPFIIDQGVTFIDIAMIKDGTVSNAKIGSFIQSTNYVAGQTGWRLDKNGTFEINGVVPGQGRLRMTNQLVQIYYANGVEAVRLGVW